MVDYRCPVCGKPVLPNFKFCKSCGARLSKDVFKKKKSTSAFDMHSSSVSSTKEAPGAQKTVVEPIDPGIVLALAVKGRLKAIDNEMEEILEEIENLEERVKVGLVPKEDAKDLVSELNKKFVELKIEKKKVSKGATNIPIFDLIETKENAEKRLSKLEDLRKDGSISKKTYEKMRREYQEAITDSGKQITNELVKMERWKDQLQKELAQKREELETLFVRKSTGELSEEEYNDKREELTEETKNWEAAINELKKLLKELK